MIRLNAHFKTTVVQENIMKKNIRLFVITLITLMLGITEVAEARKGQTTAESDAVKTSKSSSYPKSSKTDSSFANAAKTKKAKSAWQDYLKKNEVSAPVSLQKNSPDLESQLAELKNQAKSEKKHKKVDKLANQLAAIEKQIADAKRQQQLIAIAQTVAQAAMSKARQPVAVVNPPRNEQSIPAPAVVTPTAVNAPKPLPSSNSSWGLIFLIVAGVVIIIIWRRSNHSTPTTNYRL
jgi:hypothetical protein